MWGRSSAQADRQAFARFSEWKEAPCGQSTRSAGREEVRNGDAETIGADHLTEASNKLDSF